MSAVGPSTCLSVCVDVTILCRPFLHSFAVFIPEDLLLHLLCKHQPVIPGRILTAGTQGHQQLRCSDSRVS